MSERLRNYAFYQWSSAHRWLFRGRFATPQEAVAHPVIPGTDLKHGALIDLVNGRMIWHHGKYCSRPKPVGIKSLPAMETYKD